MTTRMSATAEVEQLRKKLMHSQTVISELRDELKEQEKIRYTITAVSHNFQSFLTSIYIGKR